MSSKVSERKDERIVVLCEKSYVDQLNRLADAKFNGIRSIMIRTALDEFIDRQSPKQSDEGTEQEAA